MSLETLLAVAGFLLMLCVFTNKITDNFGIPSLLLFLGMGMLAGSDGPGGIEFSDSRLTNYTGTVALAFILFSGGLGTKWQQVRPIIFAAVSFLRWVSCSQRFFCISSPAISSA